MFIWSSGNYVSILNIRYIHVCILIKWMYANLRPCQNLNRPGLIKENSCERLFDIQTKGLCVERKP